MKKSKSLKNLTDLKEQGLLQHESTEALAEVAQRFNLLVTTHMANLIERDEEDPIGLQFLPQEKELIETNKELSDPIGDHRHEVVKGVVHRYQDRCLLKVVSVCPVYCRFCFRKEMIGPGRPSLTKQELELAYDYIRNQPNLWEVILTGGDPLILKPNRIASILSSLSDIQHVEIIRIHTRIPIVDPIRITQELISALKIPKTVYVVVHANHPKEFTPEAIAACAAIVDAGIPMLSQTVLLKGVNDQTHVLKDLMKTFVRHRIKPYYLHHLDLVRGAGHFRLTIEEGQQLMKSLQSQTSGLCQPTYMLEIPGGAGKIPIGPGYISKEKGSWRIEDCEGKVHPYDE